MSLIVSHSELRTFLTCPTKHRFSYGLQRESTAPKAEALTKGGQIDVACADLEAGGQALAPPDAPEIRALVTAWSSYWPPAQFLAEQHHVKFRFELQSGLDLVGEFDAIGTYQGRRVILERKSSSEDISPGSAYWQRVELSDAQVSLYLLAAERLGLGITEILYDVLRKPALRLKKGETPEAFEQRCLETIAENPEHYFQRKVLTRNERERAAHVRDVHGTVRLMQAAAFLGEDTPRNTSSCWAFGRPCEFFPVCGLGASIDDPELFRAREGSKIRTEASAAQTVAPPTRLAEPEPVATPLAGDRVPPPAGDPQEPAIYCEVCKTAGRLDLQEYARTWLGPGRLGWRHKECSPLGVIEAGLVESEPDEVIPYRLVERETERKALARRFSF
jgi:hypothetical protein